jgi:hypothetical protein
MAWIRVIRPRPFHGGKQRRVPFLPAHAPTSPLP